MHSDIDRLTADQERIHRTRRGSRRRRSASTGPADPRPPSTLFRRYFRSSDRRKGETICGSLGALVPNSYMDRRCGSLPMHSDVDRYHFTACLIATNAQRYRSLYSLDTQRRGSFFLHFMHDYKRVGSLFDPATCRVQRLLRARVLPGRHGHRRARAAWHHSGRHR